MRRGTRQSVLTMEKSDGGGNDRTVRRKRDYFISVKQCCPKRNVFRE